MNPAPPDQKLMTSYLLGDLSEEDRSLLEEKFFLDDDTFETLLDVENELVDSYVRGELPRPQREQFEKRFSSCPELRQKVDFARTLGQYVAGARREIPRAGTRAVTTSWWNSLAAPFFARRPVLALSAATMVLVLLVGGSLLFVDSARLRNRLEQSQTEQAVLQRRVHELERQASQLAGREAPPEVAERKGGDPRTGEPELAQRRPAEPHIASFVLLAGLVRGIQEPNRLVIPASADVVRLELNLEEDKYDTYRAVLETAEGRKVWRQGRLKARPTRRGKDVSLSLPARRLVPGDYVVLLSGMSGHGDLEDVSEYYFRIVRQ